MLATSFKAEVAQSCRVLVLGSMPGIVSLEAAEYYANKRNAFWPIVQSLLQATEPLNYDEKLALAQSNGIGLWDVYQECFRQGSLDSAIKTQTAQFNDIANIASHLNQLHCIALNGKAAAKAFKRLCKEQNFEPNSSNIVVLELPSTSPAYAAMAYDEKLQQWSQLLPFFSGVINA